MRMRIFLSGIYGNTYWKSKVEQIHRTNVLILVDLSHLEYSILRQSLEPINSLNILIQIVK